MGDEGSYLRNGKLLCIRKTIETVHVGQKRNLIDNWADTSLHLLLLKCSRLCTNIPFRTWDLD